MQLQMNYSKALLSSLPKTATVPPLSVPKPSPAPPPESELQRRERLRIERENKIREERKEHEKRLCEADKIRDTKRRLNTPKTPKTPKTFDLPPYSKNDGYTGRFRGSYGVGYKGGSDGTVGKFESTLRRYHRSLDRRLVGEEKYVRHMVDPLIDAIDQKMGAHKNEIYVLLCQQSAESMTRRFCSDHPIAEFDTAIQSGAVTKSEAIGILGFHPDTAGVEELKRKHELSFTTVDYRRIYQRADETGCMTKEQLSRLDRRIEMSDMMDRGYYGVVAFMGGFR